MANKTLSAGYVCDACDKPLLESEERCLTMTDTETGVSHVLHASCLMSYAADLGWKDVLEEGLENVLKSL